MASVEKRVRNGRTTYEARWRDDQGSQRNESSGRKGDADRHAATVEVDKARGTYVEPSKTTVAEYARRWAETRPHRPTTARRTEMMIRLTTRGRDWVAGGSRTCARPRSRRGPPTGRGCLPQPEVTPVRRTPCSVSGACSRSRRG